MDDGLDVLQNILSGLSTPLKIIFVVPVGIFSVLRLGQVTLIGGEMEDQGGSIELVLEREIEKNQQKVSRAVGKKRKGKLTRAKISEPLT